jgi:hypothetical protein
MWAHLLPSSLFFAKFYRTRLLSHKTLCVGCPVDTVAVWEVCHHIYCDLGTFSAVLREIFFSLFLQKQTTLTLLGIVLGQYLTSIDVHYITRKLSTCTFQYTNLQEEVHWARPSNLDVFGRAISAKDRVFSVDKLLLAPKRSQGYQSIGNSIGDRITYFIWGESLQNSLS